MSMARKKMTFAAWARSRGACWDGLNYLRGKRPTLETWLQSCGMWRDWVCEELYIDPCRADKLTASPDHCCDPCDAMRRVLNQPKVHAALCLHFKEVVRPALLKAGVRP